MTELSPPMVCSLEFLFYNAHPLFPTPYTPYPFTSMGTPLNNYFYIFYSKVMKSVYINTKGQKLPQAKSILTWESEGGGCPPKDSTLVWFLMVCIYIYMTGTSHRSTLVLIQGISCCLLSELLGLVACGSAVCNGILAISQCGKY